MFGAGVLLGPNLKTLFLGGSTNGSLPDKVKSAISLEAKDSSYATLMAQYGSLNKASALFKRAVIKGQENKIPEYTLAKIVLLIQAKVDERDYDNSEKYYEGLLKVLKDKGCENIIILPLYPQYAAPTTATVCDEVYRSLMGMRWQPSLQVIPHYESDPFYISALIKSIEKKVASINWKPDLIISSYHGIPKKYFDKGDPYHCYCYKTTRLMTEKFNAIEIKTTFQSRFGPQEWLQPYTDKTLESLPNDGKKNVLAICPGFSSDCVETLEEILIQGKESFMESGGKNFDMIPCLNDNDDHIKLIKSLISKSI